MLKTRRLHPFLVDVLLTGSAQIGVLVSSLLCIGMVSHRMGVLILGEYLLARRVSAWCISGAQLGLGVALPREIAQSAAHLDGTARRYFLAAITIAVLFMVVLAGVASINPGTVSKLLLGAADKAMLYALILLVLGSIVHTLVYSYYRGLQQMRSANLVQVVGVGLLPIVVISIMARFHSAVLVVASIGLTLLVCASVWAARILARVEATSFQKLRQDARLLLSYGVRRVPGDFAAGGLFTVGPVIAAHYVSPEKVAFLLLGTTCLTAASMAFTPLAIVLLAKVSRLLGAGRTEDVKIYVGHLRSAVVHVAFLVTLQLLIFIKPLFKWWIGDSHDPGAVHVIAIMVLAVPAYMYFVTLRTVIDAASTKAYNSRNVVATLVFLALLIAGAVRFAPAELLVVWIASATTAAVYFLGVLTDIRLRKLLMGHVDASLQPALIAVLLGAVSLAVQVGAGFAATKPVFVLTVALNCLLLFMLIRKHQPHWMSFIGRKGLVNS